MNISQGSFFDMSIPWVVETEDGYTSRLNGTLMNPEATTSLAYRDFIQGETLEFQLDMIYPKFWNDHQEWNFTFTVSKATVNFIFAHKWFFQVLSVKRLPNILLLLSIIFRTWLRTGPADHLLTSCHLFLIPGSSSLSSKSSSC